MSYRVLVWGTGNVGRPAIRAVAAHSDLVLAGVVVHNPDKLGCDAGELAGIEPLGITASASWRDVAERGRIDAVVYTATADIRPAEAFTELLELLGAGINVVSSAFYSLLEPSCGAAEAVDVVAAACASGQASVFVSGIDPGWSQDILPVLLSGVVSDIEEVRVQEIFNYALYDQPQVVRDVIGFGGSMSTLPPMLHQNALLAVWEPMIRSLAASLSLPIDRVDTQVERVALEKTVDVPGMGIFEAGGQGAFRFEVRGLIGHDAPLVIEHITRIHHDCAPNWPQAPGEREGCHQVVIKGSPELVVSIHGIDPVEPGPAGGGNGSAANRIVNAIPGVVDAAAGIVTSRDLPPAQGGRQFRALRQKSL